jgi:hypothetical protein
MRKKTKKGIRKERMKNFKFLNVYYKKEKRVWVLAADCLGS